MGLDQEGVEMQWVPGGQVGVLLCRQAAEIFPFGHACVLQGLPKCRRLALSSRTCRAEAVSPPHHLLTPYHPSPFVPLELTEPSAPCAVWGETPAAWSLWCRDGRMVALWMGRLLGHPLDSITMNS